MNRRELLRLGSSSGALALIGGVAWGRMALARHQLSEQLTVTATGVLAATKSDELRQLPVTASRDIRTRFHAVCLNSAEFADYVCSDSFAEKLATCETERDREWAVTTAFMTRVVAEHDINGMVRSIEQTAVNELDEQRTASCQRIQQQWGVHASIQQPADNLDLLRQATPVVRRHIAAAISQAEVAGHRPTLTSAAARTLSLGPALVPVFRINPQIGAAAFAAVIIVEFGSYAWGKLNARPANCRRAISTRMSQLAVEIGDSLEKQLRSHIAALHNWQVLALTEAARSYARERIGLLS